MIIIETEVVLMTDNPYVKRAWLLGQQDRWMLRSSITGEERDYDLSISQGSDIRIHFVDGKGIIYAQLLENGQIRPLELRD